MTQANLEAIFRITDHYLNGSLLQAKHARNIEQKFALENLTEDDRFGHMSYSVASIIQSVGALEAEFTYVLNNGLGSVFGSHKMVGIKLTETQLNCWLKSVKEGNIGITIPQKFNLMLNRIGLNSLGSDSVVFNNVELMCKVRNELIHYNGFTNTKYERKEFVKKIEGLGLNFPPWSNASQFPFPHRYVGWALSRFAFESISNFLSQVYTLNSLDSPMNLVKVISELDK